MNFTIKVVLFDFDGTLVDSSLVISSSLRDVAAKFHVDLDESVARSFVGPIGFDSIARTLGIEEPSRFGEIMRSTLEERYHEAPLFDGVMDTLQVLYEHSFRLGIVSSQNRSLLLNTLSNLNCIDLFEHVISADDVSRPKPAPEPLLLAAKKFDVSADALLFLGDTDADAESARSASVAMVRFAPYKKGEFELRTSSSSVIEPTITTHSDLLKLLGVSRRIAPQFTVGR